MKDQATNDERVLHEVVFTPSTHVPEDAEGLRNAIWYAVWPVPWNSQRVLAPGRTVLLHDPDDETVAWETEITATITVPFEAVDAFRDLIQKRWGQWVTPVEGEEPSPGWGVAWKAEPVRRLDVARPDGAEPMSQWAFPDDLDPRWSEALRRARTGRTHSLRSRSRRDTRLGTPRRSTRPGSMDEPFATASRPSQRM